jgi:hypothetical protein
MPIRPRMNPRMQTMSWPTSILVMPFEVLFIVQVAADRVKVAAAARKAIPFLHLTRRAACPTVRA